jgi:fatty-acyl-CoA synthase
MIERCEAVGIRLVHMYGLTETYGPATVSAWPPEWDGLPPEERAVRRARQGVPTVLGGSVDVWDSEGAPVQRDGHTMGEVVLRGNTVMAGYLDDDAATTDAFRGGWLHSGDAAVVHPDGRIELRDRFKDVIVSGGENISTIEVEQALARHPAVLDCAVVGVPDDHWGERPKAFVELRPGAQATAEELTAFCREQLAGFKCPDSVDYCSLPRTATGKVQKFVLREREWAGLERRIN